jgi:hypothetical protein
MHQNIADVMCTFLYASRSFIYYIRYLLQEKTNALFIII